jgi:pilus assembly protein CpaD
MGSRPHPSARRRAATALRALALLGSTMMLAGCYSAHEATLDSIPNDYRLRHPIVLREGAHPLELFIGDRRGTLNGTQRAQVLAFAQEWRTEATGGILIDVPTGTPNAASAHRAAREVRSILAAAGVPPRAIALRARHTRDPRKLATLRLHYPKITAEAGPCGLWPYDLGPSDLREHSENRQYYNFGCASQRNLAAMVDNPADLVQPRAEIPAYNGRRTTVLDKYHRGESSATVYPEGSKGKISDVGQ